MVRSKSSGEGKHARPPQASSNGARKGRKSHGSDGLVVPVSRSVPPPRIFISWSGPIAKTVGEMLAKVIRGILEVEVFFSPEMRIGDPWRDKLRDNLKTCDPSLIIVTPETASHWVIWEASALHHSREDAHVIPVLLGMTEKDAPDPLATQHAISFMPKDTSEDDHAFQERLLARGTKLIRDLNLALGAAAKPERALAHILDIARSDLMNEIRAAVERVQRQKTSTIASVERDRALLLEQLDTLCDTMDSPAYFMNKRYDITGANIAANAMFNLSLSAGTPVTIDHFIRERRKRFLNFDTMNRNFESHFRNASPPPYFREDAIYDHPEFGQVRMNKVGILVGDGERCGWVVTWNLVEVEKHSEYLARIEQLTKAKRWATIGVA